MVQLEFIYHLLFFAFGIYVQELPLMGEDSGTYVHITNFTSNLKDLAIRWKDLNIILSDHIFDT